MEIKQIRYRNKVDFDYFEVWIGTNPSIFDHEMFEIEGKFEDRATCVSTQICPWCIKKYGLYEETNRTPESVEEEIKFYTDADPEDLDYVCGVLGCENGAAEYMDLDWKDCEVIE